MPRAGAVLRGAMDLPVRGAFQDKTQAIRMVIKNQNATYLLTWALCCRQKDCLPKNEDLPFADAGLFVGGENGIGITVLVISAHESVLERRWSIRRVISFHDSYRMAANAPAATTQARDLCVTLKESVCLLLSVDGTSEICQRALRAKVPS
jgi:hypothetical protein